jgi:hypothetical protein
MRGPAEPSQTAPWRPTRGARCRVVAPLPGCCTAGRLSHRPAVGLFRHYRAVVPLAGCRTAPLSGCFASAGLLRRWRVTTGHPCNNPAAGATTRQRPGPSPQSPRTRTTSSARPPVAAERTTRRHTSQRLRDSCVLLLVGVLWVRSRRSRRDAAGALDAQHPNRHPQAARRREPLPPVPPELPPPAPNHIATWTTPPLRSRWPGGWRLGRLAGGRPAKRTRAGRRPR